MREAAASFDRGAAPVAPAPRPRIGAILRGQGALTAPALDEGLARQRRTRQPLGQTLLAAGAIDEAALAAALATQTSRAQIDLARLPPDPTLSAGLDPAEMLRLGFVPWQRVAGVVVVAIADPGNIETVRALYPPGGAWPSFAIAPRRAIEDAVAALHGPRLAAAARSRSPAAMSCRGWAGGTLRRAAPVLLSGALGAAIVAPQTAAAALLIWIALMTGATTLLRAVAFFESFRPPPTPARPLRLSATPARLPRISLLIPLLREEATIRRLIDAIGRSDYPKELLDVILILEHDDVATPLALAQIGLPPWARVLTAPPDTLRTKPRAMNYALGFAVGEIVGVYDAEDRPAPDQLTKVARHLSAAPAHVGCVQGYLDFYNPRANWLARCFTIEYAIWFRVLLRGVQRMGLPIPLGGTTVFFRRTALERVGAWDAHNVTEDADLGMRLARFGYRTEMVATTTLEEANCRVRPWIRQRGRWLKGYAMTWATHMRRPRALARDLGLSGFLWFQVLFLGGLTAYLATPLFWALWLGIWAGVPVLAGALPVWALTSFFASMILGQLVMLAVALRAVAGRGRRHLALFVPTLMLYWPLGALAAYRALLELFTRPFHWEKTEHGL